MVRLRRLSLTGASGREPARSKAVHDALLNSELDIEFNSSDRSFTTSISNPPSQSGSFYQRIEHENNAAGSEQYQLDHLLGTFPADMKIEPSKDDTQWMKDGAGAAIDSGKGRQRSRRRCSMGAIRRLSISISGRTADSGDSSVGVQKSKASRRSSLGTFRRPSSGKTPRRLSPFRGGSKGVEDHDKRQGLKKRSSLSNIISNVVRRGSINGNNDANANAAVNQNWCPVIPEDVHGIIHRERDARGMHLFVRDFVLDTLAQGVANDLASGRAPTPCEFFGNIGKGKTLNEIHMKMMDTDRNDLSRKNILSDHFKSFGMALAIGGKKKDSIYMCTLFKD